MFRKSIRYAGLIILSASLIVHIALAADLYQPEISEDGVASLNRAEALRENGQTAKAIVELKVLVGRFPEYYLAYYNLGLAYGDNKEYKAAIDALNKALEIRDRKNIPEASIFNSLGVTYLQSGDYTNAEKVLKRGEENAKLLPLASKQKLFNSLGVLYLYKGNYPESEKYLRMAGQLGSKQAKNNLKILENVKQGVKTIHQQ